MNETVRHETAQQQRRPSLGAYVWLAAMVGVWSAFGLVALLSAGTLADLWSWVTGLPLVAEIAVWIAALPWMLGLWVSQLSWPEGLRIAVVLGLALGWTLASIPRTRDAESGGCIHWHIRHTHG